MSRLGAIPSHIGKALAVVLIAAAFAAGYWIGAPAKQPSTSATQPATAKAEAQTWTCSMHPQVRQPEPGPCPICAMDLIPVEDQGGGEGLARTLHLSPRAEKLAQIRTSPVERRFAEAEIRMVGKVELDETRVKHITAWVPGRIDRLYVDYTGVAVREGDEMVYLYSPDLLAAQEELIQAVQAAKDLRKSELDRLRDSAARNIQAAREKLHLLGLTKDQVAHIEKQSAPSEHLTIQAPMSGIVVDKNAVEGMYVQTGTRIYTVAELSQVWVLLDAYESDLMWVRYGQEVTFETEAYPGMLFGGRIVFIDPVLDPKTRAVDVRVNVPNPEGRLKPGMLVRGLVRAKVASEGKVMDPDLAGKWISPRHPEIVKDAPGKCDICGIPLVPAESLGYVSVDPNQAEAPLVIPASAPLITGKRAVVYVALPDKPGHYQGREIALGPRAGDHYIVKDGLEEGERVVTHGNFNIDSALQIQAKPSMMNPPEEEQADPTTGPGPQKHCPIMGGEIDRDVYVDHEGKRIYFCCPPCIETFKAEPEKYLKKLAKENVVLEDAPAPDVPPQFRRQLGTVLDDYFACSQALSKDDLASAKDAAGRLEDALKKVDDSLLAERDRAMWNKLAKDLAQTTAQTRQAEHIEACRTEFAPLSDTMIRTVRLFGTGGQKPLHVIHCPMAFDDRGADWLQPTKDVANPYFGKTMFKCGEVTQTIRPATTTASAPSSE